MTRSVDDLAADVRSALNKAAFGTESGSDLVVADTALSELVALVGTLTQERDAWVASHIEKDKALWDAEAALADMRRALEEIQAFQPKRIEWYRRHEIVFRRAPGCEPTEWEAVAFWTYTDLCEIESIARRALVAAGPAPEPHEAPLGSDDMYPESAT